MLIDFLDKDNFNEMLRNNMINAMNHGKYALPVDEDDYLMPSPGPMSQASYVDIGKCWCWWLDCFVET